MKQETKLSMGVGTEERENLGGAPGGERDGDPAIEDDE